MARIQIPASDATLTGAVPNYSAVDSANGNFFVNTGEEQLIIKNASAASITVTVVSVPCSHGRIGDAVITVPAAGERLAGPFPRELFNQPFPNRNNVNVDFSASASVTVAVIKP